MNATDILHYSHQAVLASIADLTPAEWHTPGVCGEWSVHDIIAHLAAYEHVLLDVLLQRALRQTTGHLEEFLSRGDEFNDYEVALRRNIPSADVLGEYNHTYARVAALAARLPAAELRQPGTLYWYGMQYSIEDLIVYGYHGHKREHSAQVAVYRDRLVQQAAETSQREELEYAL